MKISIGTKIQDGPWGGGNLFAINFSEYLRNNGHEVVFNLSDDDIDIILLTEPRKTSPSSAFTNFDVVNYLNYINNDALVVHRINECDEHKDTNYINKYISYANQCADATIYVSKWIKGLYDNFDEMKNKPNNVIYAGANEKIFNSSKFKPWKGKEKIKIVTHHWSNNWNKGFDVYKKIDELLEQDEFQNNFEFNFIGRLPDGFKFKNVNLIEPLSGLDLAQELKNNHLYITGSINEPSGNHHIEAAQCGLPLMYIDSGGIGEYCENFGLEYNLENLEEKLYELKNNYSYFIDLVESYPRDSNIMSKDFVSFFEDLLNIRNKLISKRKKHRKNIFKKFIYQSKRYFVN